MREWPGTEASEAGLCDDWGGNTAIDTCSTSEKRSSALACPQSLPKRRDPPPNERARECRPADADCNQFEHTAPARVQGVTSVLETARRVTTGVVIRSPRSLRP
jgi:hypothetical protein